MNLRSRVVGQFHRPTGSLGRLAGWVMSHRASNLTRNRWTVDLLELEPCDRVLELGFGPGIAMEDVLSRVPDGAVVGLDHSEVMVAAARRRNGEAVEAGRATLHLGSVSRISQLTGQFDAAFGVNVSQFWPDPQVVLSDVYDKLRPGGRAALTVQPRSKGATASDTDDAASMLRDSLTAAGFVDVTGQILPLDPPAVCVLATRPQEI